MSSFISILLQEQHQLEKTKGVFRHTIQHEHHHQPPFICKSWSTTLKHWIFLPQSLFKYPRSLRMRILAPHVGCRRVVFLPKRRHSVSCRRHVADKFQSCRRHKKMSCRLECLNDTTFDDMSGNSRHVGNFLIVV